MADRFYTPDPLPAGEYVLSGPEAHHLVTVRRFGPGDRVVLFNGDGHDYPAEVVAADRKRTVLTVGAPVRVDRELPFVVEVAAALPKGDRGDFLIEKLTELGVGRFVPLRTARTVVEPKEARLNKLRQAVIEASKQCGRNVLMRVGPLTEWADYLAAADRPAVRFLLHPPGEGSQAGLPSAVNEGVAFAVGPEGGFTDDEVTAAEAAGWRRASLGPRVLRVETAAIAAAAWAASLAGRQA
ncbi:MAG: 16S rRNA (uracil(1498)-N(3))-methyltransferase [Gemmataceae bacterium]|nr:16S rRNA (uracil(1498)-N(3))-methyltransferase [Gemmataceae bacterium]